jgi:hypothetical protein
VIDSVTGASRPLPDSFRIRGYDGEFADGEAFLVPTDGSDNRVHIGGVDNYWLRPPGALMTMTDTELTIIVPGHWWERLTETPERDEGFEVCGTWHAPLDGTARIEGTINGAFVYHEGKGSRWTTVLFCTAPDHRFTMVRQMTN